MLSVDGNALCTNSMPSVDDNTCCVLTVCLQLTVMPVVFRHGIKFTVTRVVYLHGKVTRVVQKHCAMNITVISVVY